MGYVVFTFLVFFLLAASGLLLVFFRETLGHRVAVLIESNRERDDHPVTRKEQLTRSMRTFAGKVQNVLPKGQKEVSVVRQRLVMAGYRQDTQLNIYYAVKVMLPVTSCLIILLTGAYHWQPFWMFVGPAAVGYLIPDYWLTYRIKKRQAALSRGLPDALDFMVVCLEAGLSLDQAVVRTSDELTDGHSVVAEEFGLVMLDVRAGRNRVDAWKRLMERSDMDEVRMLVAVFVQADQFGTGVAKTLRVHADTMRIRRRQRVEELAAKTPVKLVFPLVLFIFPSLYVVMLGPAVLQMMETFPGQQ